MAMKAAKKIDATAGKNLDRGEAMAT